jgi:hypothetical protein
MKKIVRINFTRMRKDVERGPSGILPGLLPATLSIG